MTRKRLLAVAALAAGLAGITGCEDESTVLNSYRINADGSMLFNAVSGSDAKCAKDGNWTHRMDNSNQRAVEQLALAYENERLVHVYDTDTCVGGVEIAAIGVYPKPVEP